MTLEEYKEKVDLLEAQFKVEKKKIAMDFAFSNNPYKVGDIIRSPFHIIKIEKIKFTTGFFGGSPECVYCGEPLTKKLKPKKNVNGDEIIYQSSVIEKLN